LTLTNYDHDHFSGLPYLRSKVKISNVKFPKNLTSAEVKKIKPVVTDALTHVTDIMDTYTADVTDYNPPFTKHCYYLEKSDFPDTAVDTNKLSQLVFITYNGTRICIPGDLTSPAWEKHLLNKNVQILLGGIDILVAPHHGREDGYNEKIFEHCTPECIILSDTYIKHDTQQGMTQLYASKTKGDGIMFNGNSQNLRKTLTTRSDGHLWIRIEDDQSRIYRSFKI
jgi:beta-lactamase superfamily II metal-dependent hydrolase